MSKEQTKCVAVSLTQNQIDEVKKVKEQAGISQNEVLAKSIMAGLKSFQKTENQLFWVKVRIDPAKMMEFGQKLQSGELSTSMIKFTYCLKNDPTVGISLWEAKNMEDFNLLFEPHKHYYAEVIDINPAIAPEEAMVTIMEQMN